MALARAGDLGANEIIRLLNMSPHPEGGHYAETYRAGGKGRAVMTAIYYLLEVDQVSAWHRVDAEEVWLWHAGGVLALVRDGDEIELDVPARRLHLHVDDDELARRRSEWQAPPPRMASGYQRLYHDHVQQADRGCDLDFLVGRRGAEVPRESH